MTPPHASSRLLSVRDFTLHGPIGTTTDVNWQPAWSCSLWRGITVSFTGDTTRRACGQLPGISRRESHSCKDVCLMISGGKSETAETCGWTSASVDNSGRGTPVGGKDTGGTAGSSG